MVLPAKIPEVVVAEKFNRRFDLKTTPFGAAAYYSHGDAFPEVTKKLCDEADVIINDQYP